MTRLKALLIATLMGVPTTALADTMLQEEMKVSDQRWICGRYGDTIYSYPKDKFVDKNKADDIAGCEYDTTSVTFTLDLPWYADTPYATKVASDICAAWSSQYPLLIFKVKGEDGTLLEQCYSRVAAPPPPPKPTISDFVFNYCRNRGVNKCTLRTTSHEILIVLDDNSFLSSFSHSTCNDVTRDFPKDLFKGWWLIPAGTSNSATSVRCKLGE